MDISVNSEKNRIFAINGTTITEIDGSNNNVLNTKNFASTPEESLALMTLNPLENKVYGINERKTIVSLELDSNKISTNNITLTNARYPNATDNFVRKMAISPQTNMLYIIDVPQYNCIEMCSTISHLVTINTTSGKLVENDVEDILGFCPDLTVDTKNSIAYIMNGGGRFVAVNATTNEVMERYYIPELQEYYPRAILSNSETGLISIVAPNGAVTVPGPKTIPELASSVGLVTAIVTIGVMIALKTFVRRCSLTIDKA